MKKSLKAALLSALVFPGVGHIFLKLYLRGTFLILAALAAFSVFATSIIHQALSIIDSINRGEIPAQAGAVAELLSNSASGASGLMENSAVIVLGACWLIGVIDSYRLGATQNR